MPAPQVAVVHRQLAELSAEHDASHGDNTCGRAETVRPAMSCSIVRPGLTDNISAAVPATIGVAKLVPKLRA